MNRDEEKKVVIIPRGLYYRAIVYVEKHRIYKDFSEMVRDALRRLVFYLEGLEEYKHHEETIFIEGDDNELED